LPRARSGVPILARRNKCVDPFWRVSLNDADEKLTGGQYDGWPYTINQSDNYARQPVGWLPKLHIQGERDPVIRIFNEVDGELVYALRIRGDTFQPPIYADTTHTIEIEGPGAGKTKKLTGIMPLKNKALAGEVNVSLPPQRRER